MNRPRTLSRWQRVDDRVKERSGGVSGCNEIARVRVGHRQRVQRRIHVARVDRKEANAERTQFLVEDARHLAQRSRHTRPSSRTR